MPILVPAQARRVLDRLKDTLSRADHARVSAIIDHLDAATGRATVAVALTAAFPDAKLEAQTKALQRLRKQIDDAAEQADLEFALYVTEAKSPGAQGRDVWFFGTSIADTEHTTPELEQTADRLLRDTKALPIGEPRVQLTEIRNGKPVVRWFFSYAHGDKKDALDLFNRLKLHLSNSKHYHFEAWHDGQILVGEGWDRKIHAAMTDAHIGVFAVSHAFLASMYITKHELPAFVRGRAESALGKRVVPVALKLTDFENTDMKGLAEHQIWRGSKEKTFVGQTSHKRDAWVEGLVNQIVHVLNAYADLPSDRTPLPTRDSAPSGAAYGAEVVLLRRHSQQMRDIDNVTCLLSDTLATPTSFSQLTDIAGNDKRREAQAVPAIAYVLDWLADETAPSLFAVLGEYGMGKTITCQRVVREAEAARERGEKLPQPFYFDLRLLTGLRDRPTPTLNQIMDECIERGKNASATASLVTAAELVQRSRSEPMVFVFDGLDEALVHLNEVDGQAFTRELLKLRPQSRAAGHTINAVRLLISCRTHYFRSLQDQNNHFTGQERGATEASHYRAMLLLPLNEAQIRVYFAAALPGLNVDKTLDLVKSVHNLTELASRPYTLRLVTEFIPEIEVMRAAGKPVYGVTLYRSMVNRWMSRDQGKHHLKPEHKLRLMAHLAAWMWGRGQRVITAEELEPWFHGWLIGQPDMLRYRNFDVDKLEEDLRTATFLVREDGADNKSIGFRFAHTSMLEFFLAQHLFDALANSQRAAWAMPLVSDETREFFAQNLQESHDPRLLHRLGSWGAPYLKLASEQWLAYALDAGEAEWPTPPLVGADLSGADLQGWALVGQAQAPLNLNGSRWVGTNLRETRWQHVRLEDASLIETDLRRAEWQDVVATRANLERANCDGATFRNCDLESTECAAMSVYRARFLFTGLPAGLVTGAAQRAPVEGLQQSSLDVQVYLSTGHHSWVSACAFAPDGRTALSASYDNTLRLWDTRSGTTLATWSGHTNAVIACAFAPDGKTALSASHDHTLRLWDTRSGTTVATWHGHSSVVCACAFSPDGATALSASWDHTLRLWDTRSGTTLATWTGHTDEVTACAFAPDGKTALSASDDNTLRLWDTRSGATLSTWTGHTNGVNTCAFAPDGKTALSGGWDRTLRLWDTRTGATLATWIGHATGVTACAFSPDGRTALSASHDDTLRLWDTHAGATLATWRGHTTGVVGCSFAPNGKSALSASWDCTLRLWDTESGASLGAWSGHDRTFGACAVAPDGKTALSASDDNALRLWDTQSGTILAKLDGHTNDVVACTFAADGKTALSASHDNTLRLWDAHSGTLLATWYGRGHGVRAFAFAKDGKTALWASGDDTLCLWDTVSGTTIATWPDHANVTACALGPDGKTAMSASSDGSLYLLDIESGTTLARWTGHTSGVVACVFAPDGRTVLSGSLDNTLRLWDIQSGATLAVWTGHANGVTACAFSPDGMHALSSSYDNTLRLWDTRLGSTIATWSGHTSGVANCAFAPTGKSAVSMSDDNTMRLWQIDTGKCIRITAVVGADHVTWTPADETHLDTVIEATADSWRWLAWQRRDADGNLLDVLPSETFGPLPEPPAQTTPNSPDGVP